MDAKNIVVFTHGGCIRYTCAELFGFDKQTAWTIPIENTSITKIQYDSGKWKLVYLNDARHLEGL